MGWGEQGTGLATMWHGELCLQNPSCHLPRPWHCPLACAWHRCQLGGDQPPSPAPLRALGQGAVWHARGSLAQLGDSWGAGTEDPQTLLPQGRRKPFVGTPALGLRCPLLGGLLQRVWLWARGTLLERSCSRRLRIVPRQRPSSPGRAGCIPLSGQTRKGLVWPASLGDAALPRAGWRRAVPTCRAARSRHSTSPRPSLLPADWTPALPPPKPHGR